MNTLLHSFLWPMYKLFIVRIINLFIHNSKILHQICSQIWSNLHKLFWNNPGFKTPHVKTFIPNWRYIKNIFMNILHFLIGVCHEFFFHHIYFSSNGYSNYLNQNKFYHSLDTCGVQVFYLDFEGTVSDVLTFENTVSYSEDKFHNSAIRVF